jgi:hypothetical protein
MGYNKYQQSYEFLKTTNENRNWDAVKIFVFDDPQSPDKSHYERLEALQLGKL